MQMGQALPQLYRCRHPLTYTPVTQTQAPQDLPQLHRWGHPKALTHLDRGTPQVVLNLYRPRHPKLYHDSTDADTPKLYADFTDADTPSYAPNI